MCGLQLGQSILPRGRTRYCGCEELYGLRQAPRAWSKCLERELKNRGFVRNELVDGIMENVSPEVIATCLMTRASHNDSHTSAMILIAELDCAVSAQAKHHQTRKTKLPIKNP
jgi:hypothetical protein